MAMIGTRHPAGAELPQDVLPKIGDQIRPLPHILEESPRMSEIGLPGADPVGAQAQGQGLREAQWYGLQLRVEMEKEEDR